MFNPIHAGTLIKYQLIEDEDGKRISSVADAAKILGVHRNTLNDLINGKRALTPAMALALEDNQHGDAQSWMNLQTAYELFQLKRERAA